MLHLLGRVQLAYVGLFLAACLGVFLYEEHYVWPVQRCESQGRWWSARYHECATPVPIWRITGRMPQGTNPIPRPATAAPAPPAAATDVGG